MPSTPKKVKLHHRNLEDAQWIVDHVNGNVPQNLTSPVAAARCRADAVGPLLPAFPGDRVQRADALGMGLDAVGWSLYGGYGILIIR